MAPDFNLKPHPLVPNVAKGLEQAGVDLQTAADELLAAEAKLEERQQPGAKPVKAKPPTGDAKDALGLAATGDVPELVTFAGYLGATIPRAGKRWCVLYLDTRLLTWLLLLERGIVFREEHKDDDAACGRRDILWVKADTPVASGNGSLTAEAQFLTGAFARAGDFDNVQLGAGTAAAATGVFCEARTIGCCRPRTERPRP